jgi:hypothetical protein
MEGHLQLKKRRPDPYLHGSLPGRLQIIETFMDVLSHVENYCEGRKSDYRFLILGLAQAKGLPKGVGEAVVQLFFNEKVGDSERDFLLKII